MVFNTQEIVEFANIENYGSNPTRVTDYVLAKFVMDYSFYQEQDMFMRYNEVDTHDHRYLIYLTESIFHYFDMEFAFPWKTVSFNQT